MRRLGLRCGILSPILWLGLIAWGDVSRPDISPVIDFISELGERGSATEGVMRYAGFIATGALYVIFAAALPASVTNRWRAGIVALFIALDGLGRLGAGVFPCDPGCEGATVAQERHRLFATIGFCSGILAALAAGFLFRSPFALVMGSLTTVFLLLMTWRENPVHAEGLWERLATGALSVWLLVFATGVSRWPKAQNARRS